ncbi:MULTISPECIES: hypothetical protein [Paraburkholderia]|uniref:Uncharacterized protein n=1 Tax=Paraburkholderia podalyriae TaxID=1938811 RepID=A0ABR7PMD7_9BURK|nr:hypothetical protein [Paraburkholderia podalyriae]MBC8747476.1 hypothetical protein [Paraburkholderia podalyriae]
MKLTGWNQAQVAELMWAYTAKDISVLQLKHALATMISRRQHKWNYSGALAALFRLPLSVLVGEDLRTCSGNSASVALKCFGMPKPRRRKMRAGGRQCAMISTATSTNSATQS